MEGVSGVHRAYASYYSSFPAVAIVIYFLRTRRGYHSLPEAIQARLVVPTQEQKTTLVSCLLHSLPAVQQYSRVADPTDSKFGPEELCMIACSVALTSWSQWGS